MTTVMLFAEHRLRRLTGKYINTWRIELKLCQTQRGFIAEQGGAPSLVLGNVATGQEEICLVSSATPTCARP